MVETPRRPTTEKDDLLPSPRELALELDPGADDLRVERAGEAAVAGDEQDPDVRWSSCSWSTGRFLASTPAASATWRVILRSSRA